MATKVKALTEAQKKRIDKALAAVGLEEEMFPELALDAMETAADKFQTCHSFDRDHWREEVAKLAAILLA